MPAIYPHTCVIERPARVVNIYGNRRVTWDALPDRVYCRLVVRSMRVGESAFAESPIVTTYTLLVGRLADVRVGDRIRDVRNRSDEVLDAGPFHVAQLLERRGPGGAVAHRSFSLERQGGPDADAEATD